MLSPFPALINKTSSMKELLFLRNFAPVALFCCASLLGFSAHVLADGNVAPKSGVAIETVVLDEVISIVNEKYVKNISSDLLIQNAIIGLMNSIDAHSDYFSPEDYKEFKINSSGSFSGIGVGLSKEGSEVKIMSVLPNSPALESGVKVGDSILEINGKKIHNLTLPQVANLTMGSDGSLNLKVSRSKGSDVKEIVEVKIKKQKIPLQSVFYSLREGVLFIKITSFNQDTFFNVRNVLKGIDKKYGIAKLKGLIIDFRDNPGGFLDQAIDISSLFLVENQKISTLYAKFNNKIADFFATGENVVPVNVPMAILINEGTASAAEIVTGAMQDNKRAVVVGTRSYGKGSVQDFFELFSIPGAAIKLTFAFYHTPNNRTIEGIGIEPDVFFADNKDSFSGSLKLEEDAMAMYGVLLVKNPSEYQKLLNNNENRTKIASLNQENPLIERSSFATAANMSFRRAIAGISLLANASGVNHAPNIAFSPKHGSQRKRVLI